TCGPSAADAPGFLTCIFHDGDRDCPPSYPDKHLAYSGFDDQRGCAPCTCGAPKGSCTAALDVFKAGACTKPELLKLDLTAAGELIRSRWCYRFVRLWLPCSSCVVGRLSAGMRLIASGPRTLLT